MVNKSGRPSIWVYTLYFPFICSLTCAWMYFVCTAENKVPIYMWKNQDPLILATVCGSVTSLFIVLMIHTVASLRATSSAGDTLNGEESDFLKISKNILQNTLEQSFLFIVNLMAAAANGLPNEKIILITISFALGRFLFWSGYLIGMYAKFYPLRGPGFLITFSTNISLLLFNIITFLDLQSGSIFSLIS